jgi:hypothetical protein
MKTPAKGPITQKGTATIADAMANPEAVVCFSGEKASEATNAAWMKPSAAWLINLIANKSRKSAWRNASRAVPFGLRVSTAAS